MNLRNTLQQFLAFMHTCVMRFLFPVFLFCFLLTHLNYFLGFPLLVTSYWFGSPRWYVHLCLVLFSHFWFSSLSILVNVTLFLCRVSSILFYLNKTKTAVIGSFSFLGFTLWPHETCLSITVISEFSKKA